MMVGAVILSEAKDPYACPEIFFAARRMTAFRSG
jgi:hypothetical protein